MERTILWGLMDSGNRWMFVCISILVVCLVVYAVRITAAQAVGDLASVSRIDVPPGIQWDDAMHLYKFEFRCRRSAFSGWTQQFSGVSRNFIPAGIIFTESLPVTLSRYKLRVTCSKIDILIVLCARRFYPLRRLLVQVVIGVGALIRFPLFLPFYLKALLKYVTTAKELPSSELSTFTCNVDKLLRLLSTDPVSNVRWVAQYQKHMYSLSLSLASQSPSSSTSNWVYGKFKPPSHVHSFCN